MKESKKIFYCKKCGDEIIFTDLSRGYIYNNGETVGRKIKGLPYCLYCANRLHMPSWLTFEQQQEYIISQNLGRINKGL